MSLDYDVAIVGAGIGGLVTGALLAKKGIKTVILEQASFLGGRMATGFFRGSIVDNGPHIYWGGDSRSLESVMNYLRGGINWQELDPMELHIREKVLKFKRFDEFTPTLRKKFSPQVADEMEKIAKELPRTNADEFDDMNGREWLEERTEDQDIFDIMSCLVTVPLTLSDPSLISAGEAIRGLQNFKKSKITDPRLVYPKKGTLEIINALLDSIIENGGAVLTNYRVLNIKLNKGAVGGLKAKSEVSGKPLDINTKKVVFNAPVYDIFNLIDGSHFSPEWVKRVKSFDGMVSSGISVMFGLKKQSMTYTGPKLYHSPNAVRYMISPTSVMSTHPYLFYGHCVEPDFINDKKAVFKESKALLQECLELYPQLKDDIKWVITSTARVIDGLARKPGLTGKNTVGVKSEVPGLYFVGDTIRGKKNGVERAVDTALTCVEHITKSPPLANL